MAQWLKRRTQGPRSHGVQGVNGSPLFQVRGPHMALDPSLFVVFTCAQSVAVVIHSFIHSFMYSFIQLLLLNSPHIMIIPKDLTLKSNNSIHIHNREISGGSAGRKGVGMSVFFPEPICQP